MLIQMCPPNFNTFTSYPAEIFILLYWCGIGAISIPKIRKTVANKGVLKYMKLGIVRYPNFS